jgi:pimeloyl-ACP methyl ester carboxylesterase
MKDYFLKVQGLKIHYLVEGQGPPLLFLHGHRSDAKRWKNLILKLGEKYTVFAPDLPGFGLSQELPTFHRMENYLPYLLEFIKQLKLENFTLMGGSMGAVLAVSLAKEIPEKIKKLVLLGPIYDKTSFKIPKIKLILALLLLSTFPRSGLLVRLFDRFIRSDRLFKPFLRRNFPKEARVPQILDYEVKQWRVMSIKVWAQTLYSLLTFSPKIQRKITIPTLLIFPKNDQYLDVQKTSALFKRNFPQSEVIYLENMLHVPKGEVTLSFLEKFNYLFEKLN